MNDEYKSVLLNESVLIPKLIEQYKDTSEIEDVDEIKTYLRTLMSEDREQLYTQMLTAFTIFMKENCLGQSVYTEYVEETKCPIDQSGPLPDLEFDPISWKNKNLQKVLVEYYTRESEHFYHRA